MANDPLMSQDEIERLFSPTPGLSTPGASGGQSSEAASGTPLSQDAIEKILNSGKSAPAATMPAPVGKDTSYSSMAGEGGIMPHDIDYLLTQAQRALESVDAAHGGDLPSGVTSYRLQELVGCPANTEAATLDLIRDVELDLKIELGRTHMYLEDVLKLRKGSVVPLDKLAGDPVDIFVNGRLIARGEVLVLNDNFCVRVAELLAGASLSV